MRDAMDMEVVNSHVAWRLLVSMILSNIDVIHTFLTNHAKINEVVSFRSLYSEILVTYHHKDV